MRAFSRSDHLTTHVRTHTGEKRECFFPISLRDSWIVPHCSFPLFSLLLRRVRTQIRPFGRTQTPHEGARQAEGPTAESPRRESLCRGRRRFGVFIDRLRLMIVSGLVLLSRLVFLRHFSPCCSPTHASTALSSISSSGLCLYCSLSLFIHRFGLLPQRSIHFHRLSSFRP